MPQARQTRDATLEDIERISIADTMFMMPMRDGVRLATDIYRPSNERGKVATILIRTPYNLNKLGAGTSIGWNWIYEALSRGYAVAVQNERGRYYSEGEWELLGYPRTDGYDALTWLAAQPWSSGSIATVGCSSSAEWQIALASQNHPAHKAMIPMGSGAGIGRVGEFYEQGNWYKGGAHQALFSVWLHAVQHTTYPRFPAGLQQQQLQRLRKMYDLAAQTPEIDWKKHMIKVPAIQWLDAAGGNTGPMQTLMARTPGDPAWYRGGLYHDHEPFAVPAFWFNSWFDVSQGPNLALFNHVRAKGATARVRNGQFVVIAPTRHCDFFETPEHDDLIVGELNVGRPHFPYLEEMFAFLDHYLRGRSNDYPDKAPRVRYYTMAKNRWASAESWPPENSQPWTFYLNGNGHANSLYGDGSLSLEVSRAASHDTFTYDPMNPVPALGGGVCCMRGAVTGGSYDQRGIEARADVLVYDSSPLAEPVEVTGSIRATLFVSSDARDTDFTVKLVDVHPDGTALNVDDTILRARYRSGYDKQVFMEPGEVYELNPTSMSTSYEFKQGHRIRVEVSSSKFPQYMRNLNTGGNNYDETAAVVARNTVHHTRKYPSRIVLPVVARSR